MIPNAAFDVVGLCRSYGGRRVLEPISFRVSGGTGLALLGENGSGKSTLMRLLAQVEKPDSGSIFFCGKNVLGDRAFLRSEIGYVPQELSLDDSLTVAQQLSLWRAACGCRANAEAEDLMGLAPLRKKRISELSGGQARRVSIAMALMNSPTVLLLDEATEGLDEAYREALTAHLAGFIGAGGILIFATHRSEEAARLCRAGITLRGGAVVR